MPDERLESVVLAVSSLLARPIRNYGWSYDRIRLQRCLLNCTQVSRKAGTTNESCTQERLGIINFIKYAVISYIYGRSSRTIAFAILET